MKKAEAISILAASVRPREAKDMARYDEAVRMAIEALKCSETPKSSDCISRQAAVEIVDRYNKSHMILKGKPMLGAASIVIELEELPSAQPEWNNHTVACLLAELFDDPCACNYNGIDEWLPEKCEVIDACPNPVGVACWEQYLKHRTERRADGKN